MKTISYGFFIYIFLTTIYVISAIPSSKTKLKCDLPDIIKKSKFAEKCSGVRVDNKTKLSELELGSEPLFLCTGIFETAKKICEVNVDIASIDETIFSTEIQKLEPITKNLAQFCSVLNNVTINANYVKTINYTAHPNLNILNEYLRTDCKELLCWKDHTKSTANPMCAILLWEYRIITKDTIAQSVAAIAEPKPVAVEPPKPDKTPPGSQELSSTHRKPIATGQDPISLNPQGNVNVKAADNGNVVKEIPSTQGAATALGLEHVALNEGNDAKPGSQGAPPSETAAGKGKQLSDVISEKNDPADSQNTKGVGDNAAEDSQGKPQRIEDSNPQNNINVDREDNIESNKGKADEGLEIADNNNDQELHDIEDDEIADNIDSPPITGKKLDSDSADQNLEPSNHGKEVISPNGAGQAPTHQENPFPKDHSLPYSGPSDSDQHFFAYFMAVSLICLVCYVGYHKKHKIMAIIFEGRKSRGGRARRRPNTAGYRKLDCNLEEAVTSQCNSNVTHVIY